MDISRLLPSIAVGFVLSGCATPYGRNILVGGYSDKKIDDSTYVVSFNGNGYATQDRVWYFWIYRCAELTVEKGYANFTLQPNEKASSVRQEGEGMMPAIYQPDRAGGLLQVKSGGAPVYHYYYVPGTTITTWNSNAIVHMFHDPPPVDQLWAFSAKHVLDQLNPYVKSNGAVSAPARAQLLQGAARTRDVIVVSDQIKIRTRASSAFVGQSVPDGFQTRSAADLRNGFDFRDKIMMQAAYSEYARRTLDAIGGDVVLAFTVSTNGKVRDARIVSSTITDRPFLQSMLEAISEADFGGKNVLDTQVQEFPILISPRSAE